jgi:hypothetical protein
MVILCSPAQFLGTRFVKLTASGEFDGLQNRRANR